MSEAYINENATLRDIQKRNVPAPWKHPEVETGMLQGMAYTSNPFLPSVRRNAVNLVRVKGWGVRETARYVGVMPGTISKWVARAPHDLRHGIPTLSSAPHTHPNQIGTNIERMIVAERKKHGRCGQVIWETLKQQDIAVSLNTRASSA